MPPNPHPPRHASAPAVRPQAPNLEPPASRRDEDSRLDDVARPGHDAPAGDAMRRDEDALLARYAALARRAHELFGEPMPAPAQIPDAIVREIEDAAHRLGPYVSAMPGARALCAAEFHALRAFDEMLESDGPRQPGTTPAP